MPLDYGVDANNVVRPLLVDSSGRVIVVGQGTSSEVNAAILAPERGLVGSHGYVAGAWQKDPIALGYSARVAKFFTATSTGGASTIASSTVVPAGEIHVVNFISFYHNDPVARNATYYAYEGSTYFALRSVVALATSVLDISTTMFLLSPGDNIKIIVWALANGQVINAYYWGYRVDIDL